MKKFFSNYKIQLKLLVVLILGIALLSSIFYFLIPNILNYPEGTYNSSFQKELENTNYNIQVVSISLAIFVVFVINIFLQTRFLNKYKDIFKEPSKYSTDEINYVRNKLYNVPYTMYIANIIAPSILITIIHAFTINQLGITTLKLFILMFSFITIYVSGVLIYAKKLFKELLLKLPIIDNVCYKRINIKYKFFYHILPLLIVSILFTTLIGYSRLIVEKGNSLYEIYKEKLSYLLKSEDIRDLNDLIALSNKLSTYNTDDIIFIMKPDHTFIDKNQQEITFSAYFNKYLDELSFQQDGRVYEYYGVDAQGCVEAIEINGESYILGVYFEISSTYILYYFLASFIVLMFCDILMLYLFANSYSSDIKIVSDGFHKMVNDDSKGADKLAVTSNDEVGDLCIAYNKVQELTSQYIAQIHSNQDILIERERLASLGQMIGGIAHNLKTPIMSISGATEGINDLIKEYDASIGNPQVKEEDYHEIAKDMYNWTEKIRNYTEYMSDVITAVKGQAVTLSDEQQVSFTIEELLKRINILMRHELKNSLINLIIKNEINPNTILHGNINSLVQVINNMISNSIQAYHGKTNENIEFIIAKQNDNIVFTIKDFAGGLPKEVEKKLFKEMITTKGKNGTGLGLFMSYSNIKAHFNGDITFKSVEGIGTEFSIIIPM